MANPLVLSVKGIDIHAQQWGNPKGMPMLGLHGWLDNSATYHRLAPYLADFNLVTVDLPGHGLSGHWPEHQHYHLWAGVEDVEFIADALGWERFHLMGHSMGASISSLYAGTFPERLLSLTMIEALGPLSGSENEAPKRLAEAILKMKKHAPDHKTVEQVSDLVHARMHGMLKLSEAGASEIVSRAHKETEQGYQWTHDRRLMIPSMMRLPESLIQSFFANISAPTCLILANDGMFNEKGFEASVLGARWALIQSNKEIHWLAGGHHLHLEGDAAHIGDTICQFILARDNG